MNCVARQISVTFMPLQSHGCSRWLWEGTECDSDWLLSWGWVGTDFIGSWAAILLLVSMRILVWFVIRLVPCSPLAVARLYSCLFGPRHSNHQVPRPSFDLHTSTADKGIGTDCGNGTSRSGGYKYGRWFFFSAESNLLLKISLLLYQFINARAAKLISGRDGCARADQDSCQ